MVAAVPVPNPSVSFPELGQLIKSSILILASTTSIPLSFATFVNQKSNEAIREQTPFDTFMEGEPDVVKPSKLLDGDNVLRIADILTIEKKDFEFKNKQGESSKKTAYLYSLRDKPVPLFVPQIVHAMLKEQRKEYGHKLVGIKIRKTGQGIETRYILYPII